MAEEKINKIKNTFVVSEGVSGNHHYHISCSDNSIKSLCGMSTMWTSIALKDWGNQIDHLNETYCKKCKKIYDYHFGDEGS